MVSLQSKFTGGARLAVAIGIASYYFISLRTGLVNLDDIDSYKINLFNLLKEVNSDYSTIVFYFLLENLNKYFDIDVIKLVQLVNIFLVSALWYRYPLARNIPFLFAPIVLEFFLSQIRNGLALGLTLLLPPIMVMVGPLIHFSSLMLLDKVSIYFQRYLVFSLLALAVVMSFIVALDPARANIYSSSDMTLVHRFYFLCLGIIILFEKGRRFHALFGILFIASFINFGYPVRFFVLYFFYTFKFNVGLGTFVVLTFYLIYNSLLYGYFS